MKSLLLILLITSTSITFSQTEIEWMTFEEAYAANKKNPKKFLVDVYTDWCGWCKRMDATTFKDSAIVNALKSNFYAVKLDGEHKSEIKIEGRTYKFVAQGRRGYHELPAELMGGKMSYPTIVFLNEENGILQSMPGYKSTEDLLPILEFLGESKYLKMTWEEFQKERKE